MSLFAECSLQKNTITTLHKRHIELLYTDSTLCDVSCSTVRFTGTIVASKGTQSADGGGSEVHLSSFGEPPGKNVPGQFTPNGSWLTC